MAEKKQHPPLTQDWIDAYLQERKGYEQKGDKEGVAAVDEQLKLGGYDPKKRPDEPPVAPTATPDQTTR